jgi:hypothetical protein
MIPVLPTADLQRDFRILARSPRAGVPAKDPLLQAMTHSTNDRPAAACSTLGVSDFIRVPFPAARTTMFMGCEKVIFETALSNWR